MAGIRRERFIDQIITHISRETKDLGMLFVGEFVVLQIGDNAHAVLHGGDEVGAMREGRVIFIHESHHDKTRIAMFDWAAR